MPAETKALSPEARHLVTNIQRELLKCPLTAATGSSNRKYTLNGMVEHMVTRLKMLLSLNTIGHTVRQVKSHMHINGISGPVYIIPLSTKGCPNLNPGGLQRVGNFTVVNGPCTLSPETDCLTIGKTGLF